MEGILHDDKQPLSTSSVPAVESDQIDAETRFAALVAYDGTHYFGWQRQSGRRVEPGATVQGAIEAALERVTGTPTSIIGAGRTDTGVHATGQVIAFGSRWRHGAAALLRAANASLPDDVVFRSVVDDVGEFHPRFDADQRLYNYTLLVSPTRDPLLRQRVWQIRGGFDPAKANAAAATLLGEHDFASFGHPPHGTNTVRHVFRSEWAEETQAGRQVWVYRIAATAFLQHMVRRIVGMLVGVGQGALSPEDFAAQFRAARLARWPLAPPHGLVLEAVQYSPAWMERLRGWPM